ncbi:MAG: hypothetical protein MJE66_24695, partial [Proteobacteria bacterium]|nr:hypothetical protein [Pseudomonadota bacterium]
MGEVRQFLVALVLMGLFSSPAFSLSVTIEESEVVEGTLVEIELTLPPDRMLRDVIDVLVERTPEPEPWPDPEPGWWIHERIRLPWQELQSARPGSTLRVQLDTLGYDPSRYRIEAAEAGADASTSFDELSILPRHEDLERQIALDLRERGISLGLYRADGTFLETTDTVTANELVIVASEFALVEAAANRLEVFLAPEPPLASSTLLEVKLLPQEHLEAFGHPYADELCDEEIYFDMDQNLEGVAIAQVRIPSPPGHVEQDGSLVFMQVDRPLPNTNCSRGLRLVHVQFDDDPAPPPLPDLATHNAAEHPGKPWLDQFPVDSFQVHIVRIAEPEATYTTAAELQDLARELEQHFESGTKGYFQLDVSYEYLSPVQFDVAQSAAAWYAALPKTPGRAILDASEAKELELIIALYLDACSPHSLLPSSVCPPHARGEDVTLYYYDGFLGGAYGMAETETPLGTRGMFHAPCNPHVPFSNVFYERTSAGIVSFHNGVPGCRRSSYFNVGSFLQHIKPFRPIAGVPPTPLILHELGHTLWLAPVGFNWADPQPQYFPDLGPSDKHAWHHDEKEWSYRDVSEVNATVRQFMSLLGGISLEVRTEGYGDEFLSA